MLLTGETGAGKSIIIDALGLALGERASADLIRSGEERASVEAIFDAPLADGILEAHGLPTDDGQVIIRREVVATGKGRASVNGALAPVAVLKELSQSLAAIHGQHEPQGLLDPDTHLPLVDHFGGLSSQAERVAELFKAWKTTETELEAHRQGRRDAERRRETLAFQLAEIEKAGITEGEEEALRRERALQANADRLSGLCEDAYGVLYEAEDAILSRLSHVFRCVEEMSGIDEAVSEHLDKRDGIRALLEDLALFLRDYREGLAVLPGRLDEIETRLVLIERLKRKYGATLADVLAFASACRGELEALSDPETREQELEQRRDAAAADFVATALALSANRRKAAERMQERVCAELSQLAMEKARFELRFIPSVIPGADGGPQSNWSPRGLDSAEFFLSPNPGEELRPLARIASGGELSRILLALKSVATLDSEGKTLVFDEVDAGIGGGVAEIVGRKLRKMALRNQVLCVTHLPQIAGLADQHLVIRKEAKGGRTTTDVRPVTGEERVDEIARMLGGETITDAARSHAREMLGGETARASR